MQAGKSRKKTGEAGGRKNFFCNVLIRPLGVPDSIASWKLDLIILILSYNISLVLICYLSEERGWSSVYVYI